MSVQSAKHIVQCEVILLLTAMKRRMKNNDDRTDPHYLNLMVLKGKLGYISDLSDIKPLEYLGPFLDIISSGEMIGLIAGLALTAVEKFLSFNYLDISFVKDMRLLQETMEKIANTVTNTKFVGTDHSSDEVILMKILKLLDTLMHVSAGTLISDSAVCKIISSCFRICFEPHLSELLRHTAECTLQRIVHLLFSRLPELKDDLKTKKKNLTINVDYSSHHNTKSRLRRKKQASIELSSDHTDRSSEGGEEYDEHDINSNEINEKITEDSEYLEDSDSSKFTKKDIVEPDLIVAPPEKTKPRDHVTILLEENEEEEEILSNKIEENQIVFELSRNESVTNMSTVTTSSINETESIQYKTSKGVVFKSDVTSEYKEPELAVKSKKNRLSDTSYGLACIQKLLSNLTMMLAPENSSHVNHVRTGLTLITAALEVGAYSIATNTNTPVLLNVIQNDLSKYLILLLNSDRLSFFAASTRACFLLFESMRHHLKFQLEMYLSRLMRIIMSENDAIPLEYREVALESIIQLWMIPGFITELYINYDCDLYASDVLQDLSDLFYRITMPISAPSLMMDQSSTSNVAGSQMNSSKMSGQTGAGSNSMSGAVRFYPHMQLVALDSLLFMIHSIHDNKDQLTGDKHKSMNAVLLKKKHLKIGTEKFNSDPKDGLKYLKNEGFCETNRDIAQFLYINHELDKKMIGELIGKRNCTEILNEYLKLFDCHNQRIDIAFRAFMEEFRLPGDSANIEIILDAMSKIYATSNPHLIADSDAAYLVIYVIIMLNVSHHNISAKKQQSPLTFDQFRNMLLGNDKVYKVDEETMVQIFESVKNEEIIMPIERKGLIKENYLWKRLLRESSSSLITSSHYQQSELGNRSFELFNLVWKSCTNAFVYVFEAQMIDDTGIREKIIQGLYQSATIAAYYNLCEIIDKILILVSKYTNFSSPQETVEMFGRNEKTQLAALTMFEMAQKHADIIRDGWKNLLDCLISLFKAKLLPRSLIEVEDLITKDKIVLPIEEEKLLTRAETTSVVNWFLTGLSLTSQDYGSGQRNHAEETMRNDAMEVVERCCIPQLIEDTRFIKGASLNVLINALIHGTRSGEEAIIKSYHHHHSLHQSASTNAMHDHHHHHIHGDACPDSSMTQVTNSNSSSYRHDEQSRVFCLELLVRVLLHNSDRIAAFRPIVYDHFYTLLIGAVRSDLLLERTVVAALRLTIQLLRKEQDLDQVFTYLEILALTKMSVLSKVNLQIVCGLRDIIHTHAANIPLKKDWKLVLTLLEMCGAGTKLDPIIKAEFVSRLKSKDISSLKSTGSSIPDSTALPNHNLDRCQEMCTSVEDIPQKIMTDSLIGTSPDSSELHGVDSLEQRGYTSDSELYKASSISSLDNSSNSNKWILLPPDDQEETASNTNVTLYSEYLPQVNQYNIVMSNVEFAFKDLLAIEKSCELLSYLINDPAHITPTNFEACVHTLRIFAEACVRCPITSPNKNNQHNSPSKRHRSVKSNKSSHSNHKSRSEYPPTTPFFNEFNEENDQIAYKFSAQLSMLMNTLHCRAKKIYLEWNESEEDDSSSYTDSELLGKLWKNSWCPLLQGMARLCSDVRPAISSHAINVLHNSLSITDMAYLSGAHWEDCFSKVLFPLSTCFLETMKWQHDLSQSNSQLAPNYTTSSRYVVETSDPRIRAIQILTKVFLQHLSKLAELSTFTALWLTFLEYMDSYRRSNSSSDTLQDAVRETLKNVLLVMYTGMQDGTICIKSDVSSQLLKLTCDRLQTFLPDLVIEVFGSHQQSSQSTNHNQDEKEEATNQQESTEEQPIRIDESQQHTFQPEATTASSSND